MPNTDDITKGRGRPFKGDDSTTSLLAKYSNRRAMIIGVNEYKHLKKLKYAVADAEGIARLLIKEFKFNKVKLLRDERATRDAIRKILITRLPKEVQPDDCIVVFFAGHGDKRKLPDGKEIGYLAPVDAQDQEWDTYLEVTEFRGAADLTVAKHVLFILDCCYSGFATGRASGLRPERFQQDRMRKRARQVITAGLDDQVVDDRGPNNHSIFTYHLIERLKGQSPRSHENTVTATELIAYLSRKVGEDPSSRQTPDYGHLAGHAGGDFVFFRRGLSHIEMRQIFRDYLKDGVEGPEMIAIPGGRFKMGDVWGDGLKNEKKPRPIVLDKPFALGRFPVTFAEYDRFAEATARDFPGDEGWGRGKRPVINVSWVDAVAYCEWLSQQTGESYRLPSEAEWEYAARNLGKEDKWSGTPNESEILEFAWFGENSGGKAQPVGGKRKNELGFYDMSGNVWEWVEDVWREGYADTPSDSSAMLLGDQSRRVVRGGAWISPAEDLRLSRRSWGNVMDQTHFIGFRIARNV